MEFSRFLACLAADHTRLREAAEGNLAAPVPSCPEWTVEVLVRHVAEVYLHKTECMRLGHAPEPWPPDPGGEPPLHRLDRAYQELAGEFAARDPGSAAYTWYDDDQTVGFWIRRMAQETVIHRVDAELARAAAGIGTVTGIPADLALDGIDEVLDRFLRYDTEGCADEYTNLPDREEAPVLVSAGELAWQVRATPKGVELARVPPGTAAGATVHGDPESVLLWLWRRVGTERVETAGDQALIGRLHTLLGDATQ